MNKEEIKLRDPQGLATTKKPNAIVMGDISIIEDGEEQEYKMVLVIEFDSAEQIRQAIKDGNVEFTIFGG